METEVARDLFPEYARCMANMDVQIGKNLARLRGDISQKELAARMKRCGWKWSQATVWTVETGERPLRLAESEDLCEILEVNSFELIRSEPEFELGQQINAALIALENLEKAQTEFEGQRRLMKSMAGATRVPAGSEDEYGLVTNTVVHVIVP